MDADAATTTLERATFGGGCFWCLEAVFQEVVGVESVVSGYAGGHVDNPDYSHVCTGTTGHAEVVRLAFDPSIVDYADLLRVFFTVHDPTTPDRQGHDRGPQYRSFVMTHSEAQARTLEAVLAEIRELGWYDGPIVTETVSEGPFFEAEAEHQNYFLDHPSAPYCRAVIRPKVSRWRTSLGARLRRPS